MNRFFLKWLAVVVVLVWSYGSPAPVRAQNPDKIDLSEISPLGWPMSMRLA